MNEPGPASTEGPPPSQRSGCLTAFMVITGLVLLLPGLCSLVFGGLLLAEGGGGLGDFGRTFGLIIVVTFLISAVGIVLIRAALAGRKQ